MAKGYSVQSFQGLQALLDAEGVEVTEPAPEPEPVPELEGEGTLWEYVEWKCFYDPFTPNLGYQIKRERRIILKKAEVTLDDAQELLALIERADIPLLGGQYLNVYKNLNGDIRAEYNRDTTKAGGIVHALKTAIKYLKQLADEGEAYEMRDNGYRFKPSREVIENPRAKIADAVYGAGDMVRGFGMTKPDAENPQALEEAAAFCEKRNWTKRKHGGTWREEHHGDR